MGVTNKALSLDVLENSVETCAELSLLARHDVYFETRVADQPALTEAAHASERKALTALREHQERNGSSNGETNGHH